MRPNSKSEGFVLIGIMILLALFALISALTFYHTNSAVQLSAQNIHNQRAELLAVTKSFDQSGKVLSGLDRFICNDEQTVVGRNDSLKSLCWLNGQSGLIDYGYYFFKAALPIGSTTHTGNVSEFGFSLTPGSNRCAYSIKFETLKALLPSVQVLSNIEQQANIDTSSTSGPVIIATPGYIDLPGTVTIADGLIIIAGGDLHLGSIISAKSPAHMQLISATGVISVGHIDPNISLSIESPIGAFLPRGITYNRGSTLKQVQLLALGFN